MVRTTFEMDVDNKVEKKSKEYKFFVGIGLEDIAVMPLIPGMRAITADTTVMGGNLTVGNIADALAVAITQIVESLVESNEDKKRLKARFAKKVAEAAFATSNGESGVVVLGGH